MWITNYNYNIKTDFTVIKLYIINKMPHLISLLNLVTTISNIYFKFHFKTIFGYIFDIHVCPSFNISTSFVVAKYGRSSILNLL